MLLFRLRASGGSGAIGVRAANVEDSGRGFEILQEKPVLVATLVTWARRKKWMIARGNVMSRLFVFGAFGNAGVSAHGRVVPVESGVARGD